MAYCQIRYLKSWICIFFFKSFTESIGDMGLICTCSSYTHIVKVVMFYIHGIERERKNSSDFIVGGAPYTIRLTIMIHAAFPQIAMNKLIHLALTAIEII